MLLFQSHGKYGMDGIAPNTSNPFEKRIKVILQSTHQKEIKKKCTAKSERRQILVSSAKVRSHKVHFLLQRDCGLLTLSSNRKKETLLILSSGDLRIFLSRLTNTY